MPPFLANGLVLLVALTAAALLAETGARVFLNPADYLSATTVDDDVLGIRVTPGTGGFDAWGFRNARVPAAADVVAIGDSHTYGNNAAMVDAWPSVVAELTGLSVYNLGLGGYGPNQYYALLKTRALTLRPRIVVCGLYLGDDFENTFSMTYGHPAWAFLRSGHWPGVDARIWEREDSATWHRRLRAWFSRNSVLYRLVVHGPGLGLIKGAVQIAWAARGGDPSTTSLVVPETGIQEAFRPLAMRDRLRQDHPAVREGMRITEELLALMRRTCEEAGCRLVVALIPTKETVFAEHLRRAPAMPLGSVIAEVIEQEQAARARLVEFLVRSGISHVDTLPALRRRVTAGLYTRSDEDMHPARNGYRVIGEAVAEFLITTDIARHAP
jgi:hypothetical protein